MGRQGVHNRAKFDFGSPDLLERAFQFRRRALLLGDIASGHDHKIASAKGVSFQSERDHPFLAGLGAAEPPHRQRSAVFQGADIFQDLLARGADDKIPWAHRHEFVLGIAEKGGRRRVDIHNLAIALQSEDGVGDVKENAFGFLQTFSAMLQVAAKALRFGGGTLRLGRLNQ